MAHWDSLVWGDSGGSQRPNSGTLCEDPALSGVADFLDFDVDPPQDHFLDEAEGEMRINGVVSGKLLISEV